MQLALKEWTVAVDALAAGETALLLRKGGIRESNKHFDLREKRFVLFPTWEHQKPELLLPSYAARVGGSERPLGIPIVAFAEVAASYPCSDAQELAAIAPFSIWNEQFAEKRFRWKPKDPLHLLLLRVYRLASVQEIDFQESYAGCSSWLELADDVDISNASPAIGKSDFEALRARFDQALSGCHA